MALFADDYAAIAASTLDPINVGRQLMSDERRRRAGACVKAGAASSLAAMSFAER
jgi:hypothetical protein